MAQLFFVHTRTYIYVRTHICINTYTHICIMLTTFPARTALLPHYYRTITALFVTYTGARK